MGLNGVMMQYFQWYLEDDGSLWNQLREDAVHLQEIGITAIWIPPCCKATGSNDAGYGLYDAYDLGEFDQKGTIRTKYGTRDELLAAIEAVQEQGLSVYADVVLNHRAGADEIQRFQAVEVDPNNRNQILTDPYEIEGWTRFVFPGRAGQHSDFQWSWEHFNGTDYNNENGKSAVYLILGENKEWADGVAWEFGNYDYLMFANVDYRHPDVVAATRNWISWFIRETGVNGIRLDAIKHINDWFIRDLLVFVKEDFGEEFYCVGEFWDPDLKQAQAYLKEVDYRMDLFDVSLHYRLFEAAQKGRDYDLRTIFDGTLVQSDPQRAVTFVDNHDSQLGQSLGSHVESWFRVLAYGLILLRREGYPCVFYGDYYGVEGEHAVEPIAEQIRTLLDVRRNFAYGEQLDRFDDSHRIGWTRTGDEQHPDGCAVVLSIGDDGEITMFVGEMHAGEQWTDRMGNQEAPVVIRDDGQGVFPVQGGTISVYVRKEAEGLSGKNS